MILWRVRLLGAYDCVVLLDQDGRGNCCCLVTGDAETSTPALRKDGNEDSLRLEH